MKKTPQIGIDILVIRNRKILLGLLSKKWMVKGKQVYGVPGRDIQFRERIGEAVRRNIKDEIDCDVVGYEVIGVNANYELGNHFIGIGVVADIRGEPKLLKPEDWESWEWFEMKSVPENLFQAAKNLIKSYLEKKVTVSE